jgi:membrane protein DedA with SNARE-associated domain
MEQLFLPLMTWVQTHGLYGVALLMVLENACFPLPTEAGYLAGQGMVDAGLTSYTTVFLWVVISQLAGSGLTYTLGRASDRALSRRLASKPAVIAAHEKMRHWYGRYGALTILFGRLVGHVRPWSSFVAGLSGVPVLPFACWTLVGTVIMVALSMWVTAIGYEYWQANRHLTAPIIIAMLVIFYGLPLAKIIQHLWKRRQQRRRAAEALGAAPASAEFPAD